MGSSLRASPPGAGIHRTRGGASAHSRLSGHHTSQSVSGPASLDTKSFAFCKERQLIPVAVWAGVGEGGAPSSSFHSSFTSVLLSACTTNPLFSLWEGACVLVPDPSQASVLGTRLLAVLFLLQSVRFQPVRCHFVGCIRFFQIWLTSLFRHLFPFSYSFRVLL